MAFRDWLIIIGLGAAFGGSFLFNEILLRELGPISISFGRVLFGAVAVWIIVLLGKTGTAMPAKDILLVAIFGFFMFALPFAAFPFSQQWITGGLAGIVNAMTPLCVVVVSHFWAGGERATFLKVLGVSSGLAGIVILSSPGLAVPGSGQVAGILIALIGPLSYAVALNHVRRLSGYKISVVVAAGLTSAAVMLLPIMLIVEGVPSIESPATWGSLAAIGLVLTGWFFLAGLTMMRKVGATASSTLTFISPISALWLGALLLGEAVEWIHLVGMAAIFLGLVFIDGRLFAKGTKQDNSQPSG